ncbi:MAG: 2-oxo acid dehydrogenase subunit E2 [Aerococcus sp.]|nr:2-oxo acid dehydrogenase subunit E2 [Aerococcus sp.]
MNETADFLPYLVKCLVTLTKKHPKLNAGLDDTVAQFFFKERINVGFEMNTVQGMFTPVIAHADQKSLAEIQQEIAKC